MNSKIIMCGFSYHHTPFVSDHTHGLSGYLFRLQTEGSSTVLYNGQTYTMNSGDLLLCRPGLSYKLAVGDQLSIVEERRMISADYYIMCNGEYLDRWWEQQPRQTLTRIHMDEDLFHLWRILMVEYRKAEASNPELCEYLLRSLCLLFDRSTEAAPAKLVTHLAALKIKGYIEVHATTGFSHKELADFVSLSISRVMHIFKEAYNQTIVEYANEIRLVVAEERIKYSQLNMEQVAYTCGFDSYSYFSRKFRQKYGLSPSDYRRKFNHHSA